jgi:hypothetical protein
MAVVNWREEDLLLVSTALGATPTQSMPIPANKTGALALQIRHLAPLTAVAAVETGGVASWEATAASRAGAMAFRAGAAAFRVGGVAGGEKSVVSCQLLVASGCQI